ncbi:hypothetical protein BCEN4_350163 [Burkholderia cenocepacia]|nr:hypothetical protein BCEN4_350163 [Burkholderia cenocepacia]
MAADGRPAVFAVAVRRNRLPRDGVGDPLTRAANLTLRYTAAMETRPASPIVHCWWRA